MQPRFEKRVGSAPFGLVEQARFRAAFDFMRLRAENGELDEVLSDWWEEFSLADDNLRNDMVDEVKLEQQQRAKPARAPRVHRMPLRTHNPDAAAPSEPGEAVQVPAGQASALAPTDDNQAPKKRRRRRRPSGRGVGGDAPAQDPQA